MATQVRSGKGAGTGQAAVPSREKSVSSAIKTGRGLVVPRISLLAALLVVVVAFGASAAPGERFAIIVSICYAIAILGNNAVAALLGEMNLSSGVSMALGAFSMCYLHQQGVPALFAALIAVVFTAVISFVIAIPTTQLTGIFTALVTFTMAFAVPTFAIYLKPITGGEAGIPGPVPDVFGIDISGSSSGLLVLSAGVLFALGVIATLLLNSRAGRIALHVGEMELAAGTFGLSTKLVKVLVWTWAGTLGAIAGVLYTFAIGYIGPMNFEFMVGIWILVGSVVAGMRSTWAVVLGGLIVGLVPVQIQDFVPAPATGIVFGSILLLTLLAGGRGLAEWGERAVFALAGLVRSRIGRAGAR